MPTLIILSGRPATGKSTLARLVAERRGATWLRIDTIEQGLRELCGVEVVYQGYLLAHRLAADNLRAGNDVVADMCNDLTVSRDGWEAVATDLGLPFVNVEVTCSDEAEHRRRVATRAAEVPGLTLPTWEEIFVRERHPWDRERIVVDTAGRTVEDCADELLGKLPT